MKRALGSIKWKLVLLYAVLVVCVILVSGIYIIGNIQQNLYQSRYQEMKYTAGRITDTVQLAYTSSDQDLTEVFSKVVTGLLTEGGNEEGLRLYLLDASGALLYSRGGGVSAADLSSRTVLGAVAGRESQQLYVHQITENGINRSVGDYAVPVMGDGAVWYILFLRQSVADIEVTMQNNTVIIVMACFSGHCGICSFSLFSCDRNFQADSASDPKNAGTGKRKSGSRRKTAADFWLCR